MNNPKKPLTAAQAMNRAAALCARSEQAPGSIREKLASWGINADDATQIMRQLTEQGFLDEERYARAFVKDKFAFNGWGRIKIAHQLRQKGISPATIETALSIIDDDQYRGSLVKLLQAKWRSLKEREPRAALAAMMRFAASRGFEAQIAGECVRQVTSIDVEDD